MTKTWKLGDNPRKHPLWQDQIALEIEMVQRGADHYREAVAKARDPGGPKGKSGRYPPEMTRILAYRREMNAIVADMGKALVQWFKAYAAKSPQHRPFAFATLNGLDPNVVAFITVRTIMDSATVQKLGLYGVARSIGMACEQEQRMNAWIASEPGLWKEVQKGLKKQRATDDHRKRVNVNRFNTLVKDKLDWVDWTTEERAQTGLAMIDVLCRVTDKIEVAEDPMPNGKGTGKSIVRLSEDMTKHIANALDRDEMRHPYYMPTLMPPKRWEGVRNGGYYTKFIRVPWLIRFNADNEEVRGAAADEYDTLDMPRVFKAVQLVQETPWRINKRVLTVAMTIWEKDLGLAGMKRRDPQALPPKRTDLDKDEEALKAWKREAAKVYGENARRISQTNATRQTILIADRYKDREFYFPHILDFRGRMYPIPQYLQPQGHDLARGLLTFANAKPVTKEDAGWLAIHLANTWGNDKINFDDRIAWVDENEGMWRRIAANPLASLEWANRDDPWQTLAAIIEWARWLEEGGGMLSSLPIRVDGTCNGIQHLSAMMRDEVAGAAVNLIPSDQPRDIYREEGVLLWERLDAIREASGLPAQRADWWLKAFGDEVPRSLTKNPVMVLPYGGTKDSYFGSIHKWLGEKDEKGEGDVFPKDDRKEMVPFLKEHLWDTVAEGELLKQATACMRWLKECAEVVAETGQPIFWSTPTGFHVRHFYGKLKVHRVETKIDGKKIRLQVYKRGKELAKREQMQGISPNFVHSMDASANMETILRFHELYGDEQAPCFTCIHDAFGTVAGSMWPMYHALRAAFIWVHSTDVLEAFREKCVLMYRDHLFMNNKDRTIEDCWEIAEDTIKRVPPRGNLDLSLIEKSDYFFA